MEQTVGELPVLDRAWAWFEINKKQVLWGVIGVGAVALALGIYLWRRQAVEIAASDAFSRVEAQFALPTGARTESAEPYLKVANDHAGTGAAARALLQAGTVSFVQGKYAEALPHFQRLNRDYPDSPLRGQALLGVAASLDAQAKPDEAVTAYRAVFEQRPSETPATQAKFALARIYEAQGKLEQARPLYEDVARAEPNTSVGNEAGLRAEQVRAKLPPPPVTNAPAITTVTATSTVPILSNPPVLKTNQP